MAPNLGSRHPISDPEAPNLGSWSTQSRILDESVKATVEDVKRLSDFAQRYAAFSVGQQASKRLAELCSAAQAQAAPLWRKAKQLYQAKDWTEALAAYRLIVQRFPIAKQSH